MRVSLIVLMLAGTAYSQEIQIVTLPQSIYVESIPGDLAPVERVFFHIILHNVSSGPVTVESLRFDLANPEGAALSGHYSASALARLFDSAVDRRRIEPSTRNSLTLGPDQRKALSDIFLDAPAGFIGETAVIEVQYEAGGKTLSQKATAPLRRSSAFLGRLPFEGTWYVAAEHGPLDPHKRFVPEMFAYDFLQIGANGKSHQRDGTVNNDYYAYGKKVLASRDGTVVFVQTALADNIPGKPNRSTPGGNVVIIDHGDGLFGYYAHMRPGSITVREGGRVRAGDVLGEVGNSGDSLEPHLHFHVMNNADLQDAEGVPIMFTNWKGQSHRRAALIRETGPLPRGEFVEPQ